MKTKLYLNIEEEKIFYSGIKNLENFSDNYFNNISLIESEQLTITHGLNSSNLIVSFFIYVDNTYTPIYLNYYMLNDNQLVINPTATIDCYINILKI